ncbi:MAG: TrkH family potassium uptake protein [Bauldia sp.]|nr:TrkH family potassium uptake protein [Bauldia sp.]
MLPRLWPAVHSLGWIVLTLAAAEAIMAGVAYGGDDGEGSSFAIGAAISLLAGGAAVMTTKGRAFELSFRDAVILTVAAWVVVPVFASVPFLLKPDDLSLVDAFFEMVSAVTTTGATVMTGLDDRPPSLLLWRSTVQWLGGFGIIGLALIILPFLKIGGMQLFRMEFTDRGDKALPRVRQIARALGQIYLGLTAACFVVYLLLGMTPFDALNHAMTTVCTGGMSTHDLSFGYFENEALHWAAVVFMIAGAIPFMAYLRFVGRGTFRERIEPQIPVLIGILGGVAALMAIYLLASGEFTNVGEAVTRATFNVASIVTTTGYSSADYMAWGEFAILVFFLITFVGGSSGSTSGGIKIMRFQIVWATIVQQIHRLVHPHAVTPIRFGGRTVGDDQVLSVAVFVVAFLGLVAIGALLLSLTGLDFLSAASGAAQAVANVGPGLGSIIGPAGSYASLSDIQKLVLCALMVLGRLEILSVLVLFSSRFYR